MYRPYFKPLLAIHLSQLSNAPLRRAWIRILQLPILLLTAFQLLFRARQIPSVWAREAAVEYNRARLTTDELCQNTELLLLFFALGKRGRQLPGGDSLLSCMLGCMLPLVFLTLVGLQFQLLYVSKAGLSLDMSDHHVLKSIHESTQHSRQSI